jgi:Meckel syndrome type 1 protein
MVSDREEDDAVTVDLGEGRADAPASAPPPAPTTSPQPTAKLQRRAPVRSPAAPAAPPPPPPALAEPYPADHLDEHVARDAITPVDASSVESTTVFSQEQKARAEIREREAGYAAKAATAPAPVAAEAAAGADSASGGAQANALGGLAAAPRQEAAPMKPANWLQEIRRLRDAGRIAEARARLVEFRRAYPNWVIPTDLAPLLRE